MTRSRTLPAVVLLVGSCTGWTGAGPGCEPLSEPRRLPSELDEASGVAASLVTPGVFWTHGDGRTGTELFAVDSEGVVLGHVEIAERSVFDAEDIASAACADGGACLYLADTGDNYAERDTLFVLRMVEPRLGVTSVTAQRLPMRLPDGARDTEAIFVLPGERLFLVSKGSDQPVTLYRYPPPLRPDTVVTLEAVQQLSETARVLPRQVTGAAAASDGSLVVLRTYETLLFHRWNGSELVPLAEEGTVNLRTVREAQGEGVALGENGVVALTSESGPSSAGASIALLTCRFEPAE